MAQLVDLTERRTLTQAAAWEAYRTASIKAQATLALDDGIAAGKAFRRWLDLFLSEDQRGMLSKAKLPSEARR